MRSAPAERYDSAARPDRAGGLLPITAVLLALMAVLIAGCGREVDISPPKAASDSSGRHGEEAQQALDGLVSSVRGGSRSGAVDLGVPASRDLMGHIHDNAAALRVAGLSMRYVDDGPPLDAEQLAALGPDAWRGSVQVAYRYAGVDTRPTRIETTAVFVAGKDGPRIASFGGTGVRTPLWLLGQLSVVRTKRTLLAVAGASAGRYATLVPAAVRQVRRVLPAWNGPLVVEVPRTRAQLDAAVEAQPGQYDNIAAVTTTADGSLTRGSPVRVFINPVVFGRLKQRGAQVVLSHEATHVATGATFTSMPTWLLEGFADFVALNDAGVPVGLAAGQILGQIRKTGLPAGLPTTADLDPTAHGLGATYEEAWLACRFLAQQHGIAGLIRFYRRVSGGASAQTAFRSELGTTQQQFVTQWRADLARLARVTR